MAENTEVLFTIKVDTSEAAKLGTMNTQLDQLRNTYKKIAEEQGKNSEEATKAALAVKRQADETRTYEREVLAANKANEKTITTLAGLRAETAKLNYERERVKIGSDRYKELTKELENNRKAINNADEAAGRFNGNVGNYAGGIQSAFKAMGVDISGVTNAISSAGDNLKQMGSMAKTAFSGASQGAFSLKAALISSGIGAIIVAIGVGIAAVSTALGRSEAASDKFAAAWAGIKAILKPVFDVLESIGKSILFVIETMGKLAEKFSDSAKAAATLERALDDLEDKQADMAINEAKRDVQISDLRNKAKQRDKFNVEERRKFLQEALRLEELNFKEKLKFAQAELKLLFDKAELDKSISAEEKRQLQAKYVDLIKLEANFNNETRRMRGELSTFNQEETKVIQEEDNKKKELAAKRTEELKKQAEERKKIAFEAWQFEQEVRLQQAEFEDMLVDYKPKDQPKLNYMTGGAELEVEDSPELIYAQQVIEQQMQYSDQMNDYQYEQYKNYLRKKIASDQEYNDTVKQLDINRRNSQIAMLGQTFGIIKGITKQGSEAYKAAATAEAVISTYEGANKALGQGGIFGFIGAAAVIAAGMANVSQILSTNVGNGYASGGYTGNGGKYEPAGIVHKGEFVFSKSATSAIGINNLNNIHSRYKGYAEGGVVGVQSFGIPDFSNPQLNQMKSVVDSIVSIPVTVLEKDISLTQKRVGVMNKAGNLF